MQGRDPLANVGLERGVGQGLRRAVRADEGRGDGVDVDPVLAPFDGEALRQVGDGGLRRAIDRLGRQGDEPGLGAQVDDPAAALADHGATRGLAGEEGALDVHGHGQVEVGLVDVDGEILRAETGVVDEDVEPSEPLDDGVDRRRDLADPRDVHLDAHRATTHALDLGDEVVGRPVTTQSQGDVGTGVGEREGDRPTEPARGTRHERGLTRQREAGELRHLASLTIRAPRGQATAVYR